MKTTKVTPASALPFTREQLFNNECTHAEYYSDFVTPHIKNIVGSYFKAGELAEALKADQHLNTIALSKWDNIGRSVLNMSLGLSKICKDKGDVLTQAGLVCICKEAARQIVADNTTL